MVDADRSKNNRDLGNFLGFSDAADEPHLEPLFYETSLYTQLKLGPASGGRFVLTGPKGSGKTAIRRYASEKSSHSLLWSVSTQERFLNVHTKDLGRYPSEVEGVILNLVLTELTKRVLSDRARFPDAGVKLAQQLMPQLLEHFKTFLSAGKVKTPVLEWDLEKLFAAGKTRFTQFSVDRYVDPLKACFATAPALVLFDDIDDNFLGADTQEYPAFVEGLIRACKAINLKFGRSIHFLLFIKYGIFRAFYEHPQDYDKVKPYISVLRWTERDLETLLARRIAASLHTPEGGACQRF